MALRSMLLILAIFVATIGPDASASTGHGSVYVTTLPPGATVWMDGGYMGATPLFIDGLDSGRHYITLTRSGWQPQSTAADVTTGRVTTVSAVLSANAPADRTAANRPKGILSLRGVAGAKAFVDGVPLPTPYDAQPLVAGDHILLVQRGNDRVTSTLRIYPDTTTTVSLAPRAAATNPDESEDVLAALSDYVPTSDFTVSGDEITIHYKGIELECAVGSHTYVYNGKPGTLAVAPAMVGDKPYLPLSLLNRIASQAKNATH
jgi:hypothetical protein